MFYSKKNPFLAKIITSKNLKEEVYVLKDKQGKTFTTTNIKALEHFFEHSKKNQQMTIQNILSKNNYSVKEINLFAKNYAQKFMANKR